LKVYRIKSVLSVHWKKGFKFLSCLVKEKINIRFLLASLKILCNFKECSESRINSFPAFLPEFLQCTMFVHGWLLEQFSGSQAAFGTTFRVTGGYQASCRVLQEGFSSDFIEKAGTLIWTFFTKRQSKIAKHQRANKKIMFYFSGPSNKYAFRGTIPLNALLYSQYQDRTVACRIMTGKTY
jgi:hypothetical protein